MSAAPNWRKRIDGRDPGQTAAQAPAPALNRRSVGARVVQSGFGGNSWSIGGGTWLNSETMLAGTLPGSKKDYAAEAGVQWLNGAVATCLDWISENFSEPELEVVQRKADGSEEAVPGHEAVAAILEPNDHYGLDELVAGSVLCEAVYGDHYWLIGRATTGPKQLWWVPSWEIRPRWPADGSAFISSYDHYVDGVCYPLRTKDVIHFRRGLNPFNPRQSIPRLQPFLRAICGDNAVDTYMGNLIGNMGLPGVVISSSIADDELSTGDADDIRDQYREEQGGDQAGSPMILSRPIKVDRLALSPEEMALDRLGKWPEARIAAAFRIPPQVLGFHAGDDSKTYANMREAVRMAYLNGLIPIQKRLAKALTKQYLRQVDPNPRRRIRWNYTRVEALREDTNLVAKRVALLFAGNIATRNECRAEVGLPALPPAEGDVFFAAAGGDPQAENHADQKLTDPDRDEGA